MKPRNLFLMLLVLTAGLLSGCTLQDQLTQRITPLSFEGVVFQVSDQSITLFIENSQAPEPIYVTLDPSAVPDYKAPELYSSLRVTTPPQADVSTIQAALSQDRAAHSPELSLATPLPIKQMVLLNPATEETQAQIKDIKLSNYIASMSLEEKVGQLFFARYPGPEAPQFQSTYQFGGYILFGRDFADKNADQLRSELDCVQQASKTPMLLGVDEEGGEVVRVSQNPALRAAPFGSPQLLLAGGPEAVKSDTLEKDALLKSLGLKVNFAPVCDLSQNPADYIYSRTTGQGPQATSDYIKRVVETMETDKMGSVLKHFPGYGPNIDTHKDFSRDTRALDSFKANDFLPFEAGIAAGADSVLVSHNVIEAIDPAAPASLSPSVHNTLRQELQFKGVIMTDDLDMDAITKAYGAEASAIAAIAAGNDMIISSRYAVEIPAVIDAVKTGAIPQDQIDTALKRVLVWKMDLDLLTI